MTKLFFSTVAFGLFATTAAFAADDIFAQVRALAPAGSDLAQYQIAIAKKTPEADAEKLAQANFVFHDFNQDGVMDLAVIFETNPTFINYDTNQACTDFNPDDYNNKCSLVPGQRTLQIFMGQKDGSLQLAVSNEKIVLTADDGGVWGDPLEGFSFNKRGSLMLSVYGGSSWRWWHIDTIQFRGNGFYIVGETDGGVHNIDPDHTATGKDVNLLTGEVLDTKESGRVVRSFGPLKPLVNLKDFVSPMLAH